MHAAALVLVAVATRHVALVAAWNLTHAAALVLVAVATAGLFLMPAEGAIMTLAALAVGAGYMTLTGPRSCASRSVCRPEFAVVD